MRALLSCLLFAFFGCFPVATSLVAQVETFIATYSLGPGIAIVQDADRIASNYNLEVQNPFSWDRARLARDFPTLPPSDQLTVLNYLWPKARCPEFTNALAPLAQLPKEPEPSWQGETICDRAFIRLYELSQETVRPLILDDLKRAKPLLSSSVLMTLPDKELPQLDDALLANLNNPDKDLFKIAPVIERYATAKIMPQVVAFYQQKAEQGWACSIQTAFLRYWLKHDRPAALQAIEKAVNLRKSTGCYKSVLGQTLHDSFYSDAEALARKYAGDPDPDVAADAQRLLDQHPPIPGEIR
jgi:hypothetical protein